VCVVDSQPRTLTGEQKDALRRLSRIATTQLELRRLLTTERKLVDDLRELDRQKAEFTAVVAHDFRSPLTSIRGYTELMRENAVPQETALDAIDRNSTRLIRLVDDLTGSPAELELEQLDVAAAARAATDLARPAAQAADVRLELDLRPAPAQVDAARLAQILDNLVGNAVKYSPHGVVRVSTRSEDGKAVVEIADTGVGIPEAELPRLFDRFFRASTSASFHGTGIGLSTVKALVEAHGGTIDVTSRVGAGTTFRVELAARRG
jgi:signal transduction histidine kinase